MLKKLLFIKLVLCLVASGILVYSQTSNNNSSNTSTTIEKKQEYKEIPSPLSLSIRTGGLFSNAGDNPFSGGLRPYFGGNFEYFFSRMIGAGLTVSYSQDTFERININNANATIKSDFLNFHLYGKPKYSFSDNFAGFLTLGFKFGMLMTSQYEDPQLGGRILEFNSQQNSMTNFLSFGIGSEFLNDFIFEIRYEMGLGNSVDSPAFDEPLKRNSFQIEIGYKLPVFGPERIPVDKGDYPNKPQMPFFELSRSIFDKSDGEPVEIIISNMDMKKIEDAEVVIYNNNQEIVKRIPVNEPNNPVKWNGQLENDMIAQSFSKYDIDIIVKETGKEKYNLGKRELQTGLIMERNNDLSTAYFKGLEFDNRFKLQAGESSDTLEKVLKVIKRAEEEQRIYVMGVFAPDVERDSRIEAKKKGEEIIRFLKKKGVRYDRNPGLMLQREGQDYSMWIQFREK